MALKSGSDKKWYHKTAMMSGHYKLVGINMDSGKVIVIIEKSGTVSQGMFFPQTWDDC